MCVPYILRPIEIRFCIYLVQGQLAHVLLTNGLALKAVRYAHLVIIKWMNARYEDSYCPIEKASKGPANLLNYWLKRHKEFAFWERKVIIYNKI